LTKCNNGAAVEKELQPWEAEGQDAPLESLEKGTTSAVRFKEILYKNVLSALVNFQLIILTFLKNLQTIYHLDWLLFQFDLLSHFLRLTQNPQCHQVKKLDTLAPRKKYLFCVKQGSH